MTEMQLKKILDANPQIKVDENHSGTKRLPNPERERDDQAPLESVRSPEIQGLGRPLIRVISRRVRQLDFENLTQGCKPLFDGLEKAGVILSDSPKHIDRDYVQELVKTKREETTFIEIIWNGASD
jgi:hypothetical protein